MTNKFVFTLLLLFVVAGPLVSCRKENKNNQACAEVEFNQQAVFTYKQPCGLAISNAGIMVLVEYNGFNAYGSNGITRIWQNFNDFLANKPPIQTLTSRGAEAVAFDGNDNLYIAETEATAGIQVYKKIITNGAVTYQPHRLIQGNTLAGGFVNPRGLAFDSSNRLYIANDGVGNLIRVDNPMGTATLKIITSSFGSIKGLAINGTTLYITLYDSDLVYKCTLRANGDFDTTTAVYRTSKPVDIAVKDGVLAISSPESGIVTLINTDQMVKGNETYTGCKKEISVGSRVFGLAFTPLDKGLFAAHLGMNRVIYYKR